MSKEFTTLKDIAKHLGLHHTTISKALRDHPDIKLATRELVKKTARELDYHPSAVARSFKNNQSTIIGICVPLINLDFFANAICGAETVLDRAGYTIMVCQAHEDFEREVKATSALISNHVAGLLISPAQNTRDVAHLESFRRRGIPVVCFDREIRGSGLDAVVVDDEKGAFSAVSHLIESGRRRIAHLAGPQNLSIAEDRWKGYLAAHSHHGIDVSKDLIVHGAIDQEAGAESMRRLLDKGLTPDAVFAVNDMVAIGAHREISGRGLKIPEKVAIVGYGDLEISSLMTPPLSTVKQSPAKLGEAAAEMILERIKVPGDLDAAERQVLPAELVIRESSA